MPIQPLVAASLNSKMRQQGLAPQSGKLACIGQALHPRTARGRAVSVPTLRLPTAQELISANPKQALQSVCVAACGTAACVGATTSAAVGLSLGGFVLLYGGLFVSFHSTASLPIFQFCNRAKDPAA